MSKPTNFDIPESLEVVWDALFHCDADTKCENWNDVTTAMAWITEALGYDISTADDETNGEYIKRETPDEN